MMTSSQNNTSSSQLNSLKQERAKRIRAIFEKIFLLDPELRCVVVESYRNDEWESLGPRLTQAIVPMDRIRYYNVQDHLQKLGYVPQLTLRDPELRASRMAHYFQSLLNLIPEELPALLE